MEIYISEFIVFLMMLMRVSSLIVTVPFLGHQSIPLQIKVGLALFISYVLFPVVSKQTPAIDLNLGAIVFIAAKESLVGILMGFSLGILFEGMRYAGELMSMTMGLSISNVFDPESGANTPVIGEFIYISTLLIFLVINGHHFVFESLDMTFRAIPIGTMTFGAPVLQVLVHLSGLMFVMAMKIAAPVVVAGFLVNVGLSILARVMPQANIFMLSFPISIGVGLLVLFSSVPLLLLVFKKLLTGFEISMIELVKAM